jgi:hypothetical protein
MKFENNWKQKTLESLEKNVWKNWDVSEGSYLIKTCHALRKKQLIDFKIEDFRIMISQDIGLIYLIPLALEILEQNILAEGDNYEGDLLKSVLTSSQTYWRNYPENWKTACQLFEKNKELLKNYDTVWEIKKEWFDSYNEFLSII